MVSAIMVLMSEVTRLLEAIGGGDPQATAELLPLVYNELRQLAAEKMAQEKPGQTLQATALVHEAYLRLVDVREGPAVGQPRPFLCRGGRGHAADSCRTRPPPGHLKHGGERRRVELDEPAGDRRRARPIDLLALDEALGELDTTRSTGGPVRETPLFRRPVHQQAAEALNISPANRRSPSGLTPGPGCTDGLPRLEFRENRVVATRASILALSSRGTARLRMAPMVNVEPEGKRPVPRSGRNGCRGERHAYLDEACGDDAELRDQVERLARRPATEAGSFLESPARSIAANQPRLILSAKRPGTHHRPLQAAAADRRRGHGRRLHGRADRAGPADGRAQDHQAGHGHAAGDRPLRGRAAGPGDDGPSEHRQGARRRRDRQRPALLRDGAGQGRADHQVLRRTTPAAPRAAGAVHAGLPGGAARPSEGHHPPRHQAHRTCSWPSTTTRPCPR